MTATITPKRSGAPADPELPEGASVVVNGRSPQRVEEAVQRMKIVDAVYKAARTGREVVFR